MQYCLEHFKRNVRDLLEAEPKNKEYQKHIPRFLELLASAMTLGPAERPSGAREEVRPGRRGGRGGRTSEAGVMPCLRPPARELDDAHEDCRPHGSRKAHRQELHDIQGVVPPLREVPRIRGAGRHALLRVHERPDLAGPRRPLPGGHPARDAREAGRREEGRAEEDGAQGRGAAGGRRREARRGVQRGPGQARGRDHVVVRREKRLRMGLLHPDGLGVQVPGHPGVDRPRGDLRRGRARWRPRRGSLQRLQLRLEGKDAVLP